MEVSVQPRRGLFTILPALVAAAFVLALPAGAGAGPVGGGSTTLSIDKGVGKALSSAGVKVKAVKPATAGKGGLSFPITDGELSTGKAARGHIDHSGGVRFAAGGEAVVLRSFRVVIGKQKAFLVGRAGKAKLTVFTLDLAKAKVSSNGGAKIIKGVGADLSKAAAGALNAAFGTDLFARGLRVGSVRVKATSAVAALAATGATTLALDPGAASALSSLGISAAPIGPATSGSAGIAFPITGGSVNAKTLAGTVDHSGGLRLSDGGTTVDLRSFTIRIDDAPDLTADVGGSRVSILRLDLSQAQAAVKGKSVRVSGVRALLSADAAAALNAAFGTSAFTAGLLLGTASVDATAR